MLSKVNFNVNVDDDTEKVINRIPTSTEISQPEAPQMRFFCHILEARND